MNVALDSPVLRNNLSVDSTGIINFGASDASVSSAFGNVLLRANNLVTIDVAPDIQYSIAGDLNVFVGNESGSVAGAIEVNVLGGSLLAPYALLDAGQANNRYELPQSDSQPGGSS